MIRDIERSVRSNISRLEEFIERHEMKWYDINKYIFSEYSAVIAAKVHLDGLRKCLRYIEEGNEKTT